MAATPSNSRARRAWHAPACALGVALGLVVWGCLNPWPDDYPSNERSTDTNTNFFPPTGEDGCRANPLSQDCNDSEGSQGAQPVPGDIGLTPSADAGAPDAGPPDASVSANE